MRSVTQISKLIAMVLRHRPEKLGLTMDAHGWVSTRDLIERLNALQPFDMAALEEIVRTDGKQRYSFNADKTMIRANQGHSIPVDLELVPLEPPKQLWHGTATRFADSIDKEGLRPMQRQYVHLSDCFETAVAVGRRHGKPLIYRIDAEGMYRAGHAFYRSENGVWLTDSVPPGFMERADPVE